MSHFPMFTCIFLYPFFFHHVFDVKEEAFTRLWSRVFTLKFEIQYFFLNYNLNEIWLVLLSGIGTARNGNERLK